ncbi:MAG: hypothetical protein LW878_12415 [Proteobacteria bacterium]|jgi:hypothetical protein|nr:hypothetical protein [Pseudomonadota bacterium]
MHYSKSNIIALALFCLGCSSSTYQMRHDKDGGAEIITTPDRVSPNCEKVVKDDGTQAAGFMIHILDEEKTVATATGMLTTPKACEDWKNVVEKILENGRVITLSGFGNMHSPRVEEKFSHFFKAHGTFLGNGRSMDFFSIRNNQGACYSHDPMRCD